MATVRLIGEDEATGTTKAVYDDIRNTFGIVPSLFKAMAHNPEYLQAAWQKVKVVMGPGQLEWLWSSSSTGSTSSWTASGLNRTSG